MARKGRRVVIVEFPLSVRWMSAYAVPGLRPGAAPRSNCSLAAAVICGGPLPTLSSKTVQRVMDDGRVKQLAEVRLRPAFVARSDPAPEGSDRKLPERKFRPPSTRLVTSRGSLLRFALLTYFEAQTQLHPGQSHVSNSRPLVWAGGTDIGWIDLLVEDTRDNKAHDEKTTYLDAPAKMLDQLKGSVKRLARPENELVALPGVQNLPTSLSISISSTRAAAATTEQTSATLFRATARTISLFRWSCLHTDGSMSWRNLNSHCCLSRRINPQSRVDHSR